jgi:hypothetical protein
VVASLLALVLACGQGPEPDTPPAVTAPPLPAPAARVSRWQPGTIRDLRPVVPAQVDKTQLPILETDEIQRTVARLTEVVDRYGGDPDNPWAIGHGLLARGADFELTNKAAAVPHLFSAYAEGFEADGSALLRFPDSKGDVLVQPHSALLLKALTEAGVSPDTVVQVAGQPRTVAELYQGAIVQTYLVAETNHTSFASPNDVPWAVQALAAWAPPDLAWQAVDGTETDLDGLTDFVAAVVARETRFMAVARQKGIGFEKRGQGIFQYTCGGAHLIQGLSFAVARGFGGGTAQTVAMAQGQLLLYRFPIELNQIEQGIKKQKAYAFRLNVQRLKLTGHTLETLHKMSAMGQLDAEVATKTRLDAIALQVVESVRRLDAQHAFDKLDKIRTKDNQLYLDIVGDASHALRGLELALGRQGIAYR